MSTIRCKSFCQSVKGRIDSGLRVDICKSEYNLFLVFAMKITLHVEVEARKYRYFCSPLASTSPSPPKELPLSLELPVATSLSRSIVASKTFSSFM